MARRYFYTEKDVSRQRMVNQRVLGEHAYVTRDRRRRGKIPRRREGGTGTDTFEALRIFEALEFKRSDDVDLEVAWLDFNSEPSGETDIVYDFDRKFIAVPEGYLDWPGEGTGTGDDVPMPASRGVAFLRQPIGNGTGTGTGDNLPERWEIVDTETWAKFIVVEFVAGDSGDPDPRKHENWYSFCGIYRDSESFTDWARLDPQVEEEPIRISDFTGTSFLVEPIVGDVMLMMLVDANGFPDEIPDGWEEQPWAPAYMPVAVFDRGTIVRVGREASSTLINKTGDVFPGMIATSVGINPGLGDIVENCWITDLTNADALLQGTWYIGRFTGIYTEGEETYPRYVIKSTTGVENFRAIRGQTGTDDSLVSATDDVFEIKNIKVLAGGLDPRSDPEDSEELVSIFKVLKEEIPPGSWVTALYSPAGTGTGTGITNWELATVERYRLIRGEYSGTTGDSTVIRIKSIQALASGDDPREDPTDADEEIQVKIIGLPFNKVVGDKIYAAYNYGLDFGVNWEVIPDQDRLVGADNTDERQDELYHKLYFQGVYDEDDHNPVYSQVLADPAPDPVLGAYNKIRLFTAKQEGESSSIAMYVCTLAEILEAGDLERVGIGTGDIYEMADDGEYLFHGTGTIFNPFRMALPKQSAGDVITYPCFQIYDNETIGTGTDVADIYAISGIDILHLLASLFGYDRLKVLFVPSGGDDPPVTEIGWYGRLCPGTGS